MATPTTFDIGRLLTPISDEQPAGPELRTASQKEVQNTYYAVRDARKKAADAERRVREFALLTDDERKLEPGAPDSPDWDAVRRLALEALTKSKDLWIAAWLIEAVTRLDGFAGLRDGFRLVHQLCDRFWQDVHPRLEKGNDHGTRFAQLAGLNGVDADGTLVAAIMNVPIAAPPTMRELSWADYKDAIDLERKDDKIKERKKKQGAVTLEMFGRAIAETPVEFLENLLDDLQQAIEAHASLYALLGEKVSDKSLLPPSSRMREALAECLRLCKSLTKDVLRKNDTIDGNDDVKEPPGGSTGTSTTFGNADLETRQEALRTLRRVADYFRLTEPHSPVSYTLEQAVRWADMALPELLSELVADKSAREEIFRRAGIIKPSTDK